jgi:hypothetical protein
MADTKPTLEDVTKNYLDRRGGVVIERLINVLKRIYDKDASDLQSEEEFKNFLSSKPDVFRVAVSCNGVERARLTSPRRASKGLIGLSITALDEMVRYIIDTLHVIMSRRVCRTCCLKSI